jgi:transcriptional regulator of heat shock response
MVVVGHNNPMIDLSIKSTAVFNEQLYKITVIIGPVKYPYPGIAPIVDMIN